MVHDDAGGQAADQVHQDDDERGDGVAFHEARGAVHGPVEVRLLGDVLPPALGFICFYDAGVQVCVYGHLLAGHRVQGEAGRHFGHAAGAVGDDHELYDDQYEEDHEPDDQGTAHHEMPEGRYDRAGVRVQQDEPCHGDV